MLIVHFYKPQNTQMEVLIASATVWMSSSVR